MSHQHAWPGERPCTPLADDVCIWEAGESRFLIAFDAGEERRIVGSVPIGDGEWSASGSLAEGNLTLSPSVDWHSPPRPRRHGWVRDGKWVEA